MTREKRLMLGMSGNNDDLNQTEGSELKDQAEIQKRLSLDEHPETRYKEKVRRIATHFGWWLFTAFVFSPIVSQAGTIAWWWFQGGVADQVATTPVVDNVNGFNATPFGGPVYRSVAIPQSKLGVSLGLEFNGSSSRLYVPDNPAFYLTNALTLEAFINYKGGPNGAAQIVFRGDDRIGFDPYSLLIYNGRLTFMIVDGANNYSTLSSPDAIVTNQILHVAGTWDGSSGLQKLFINGTQVAAASTAIRPFGALVPSSTPGIGIGNVQSSNYNQYFEGIIDLVRISDTALSPDQFLNTNSPPHVGIQLGVQIAWATEPYVHYQAQSREFLNSGQWSNLGALITGTGNTNYLFDPLGRTNNFYQVLIVP